MLDNLANVDLSGVGGYIHYTYDNTALSVSQMLIGLGIFIFFIVIAMSFHALCTGTKSQRYKEFLVDMWIAGRVKQLAQKDNIDLDKEIKEFNVSEKKRKLEQKSLLSTVESEMKEKVAGLENEAKAKQ